jgi:outer membrane protein assembly factor BamB
MCAYRRTVAVLSSLALGLPVPIWDHPGYDAEDSHFNPRESAITASTVGHLRKSWSANLRQVDESCSGFSAPIVGGDLVYVTDREGVSGYGVDSGDLRVRFTWDDATDNSTPRMAVAGKLLILANGGCNSQSDPDGRLTALDEFGKTRWQLRLDPPIDTVVVDKNVILTYGTSPSDVDTVAAYRVSDGRQLWHKQGYASSGVSADGLVPLQKTDGFGVPSGETIAVDIATGSVRWSQKASWQVQAASPAFGHFYAVNEAGALASLNAATGAVVWSMPGKGTPLMAVDGPRVYLAAGSTISSLDAGSGRAVWSRRLSGQVDQPVLAAGLLYTGGPVLNAATGALVGPSFPGGVVPAGAHLFQADGPHLTAYVP